MEELDDTHQKVTELSSVYTNENPKDHPPTAHSAEASK